MGCGSSSLKGDAPTGINASSDANDPAPRPVKKTVTNFSTPDYAADNGEDNASKKRRNTEYAPHETERQPSAISEAVDLAGKGVDNEGSNSKADEAGAKLEPYHTIEDDEPMSAGAQRIPPKPAEVDPTSTLAKDQFAASNDPSAHQDGANMTNGESDPATATTDANPPKKQSWLGKTYAAYDDAKSGRKSQISEEDMMKYTGKSKQEVQEQMEKGEGVGGGQRAGAVYVGGLGAEAYGNYGGGATGPGS